MRVSGRASKRSPTCTTDVVMDTTDENETRIALVSFSSRLGLQLMLTLKTCSVKKESSLSENVICFPIDGYVCLFVCLFKDWN